jgi:E3 ubiquitin-protein ligase BRE1
MQLLDEIKIMLGKTSDHGSFLAFPSALLKTNVETFQEHLQSRSSEIASAISELFARSTTPSPEISNLQGQIATLLASEKGHITALEKSRLEQEQLLQRLEAASTRYILAERKVDRAKSVTVAKLERQATSGGRVESGSGLGGGLDGPIDEQKEAGKGKADNGDGYFEAERARKEAVAALAKQKEQLDMLEAANEKLSIQVTALNNRLSHLSDDDYSQTDLFKQLRSQHEDVIKRINHLEATNIQLREEAEKLQKERTAYRIQLENETQTAVAEKEAQLAHAEHDLARIRSARDELLADVAIRKATQNQERASIHQIKELASAKEERVKALEFEVERLIMQSGQSNSDPSPHLNISPTDLPSKFFSLERQHSMLKDELESMDKAYKKVMALASQKVENFSVLEEKITRLSAEKSKADQKYFATMKAKEAREQEVRSLRASSSKSSEMVSTLKDAEAASRAALVNHDKELVEFKASYASISNQYRICQQQLSDEKIAVEALKAQAEELKASLLAKDSSAHAVAIAHRKAEIEIETLTVRLEETQRSLESWKKKGVGNQSEEYEMLRVSFPFD